jgi:hypothetical protein
LANNLRDQTLAKKWKLKKKKKKKKKKKTQKKPPKTDQSWNKWQK